MTYTDEQVQALKLRCFDAEEHIKMLEANIRSYSGAVSSIAKAVGLDVVDGKLSLDELVAAVADRVVPF